MFIVFLIIAVVFLILWRSEASKRTKETAEHNAYREESDAHIQVLSKYEVIVDAEAEAAKIRNESDSLIGMAHQTADRIVNNANQEADAIKAAAKEEAKTIRERANATSAKADAKLSSAETTAAAVIAAAREKATQIAGDALTVKENAEQYEATAIAMRNVIQGYGDEWLKPTYSLLDELAEELGYTEAGQQLKEARAHSSRMVQERLAATCDYVEANRKNTAINFVVDAFNGKVDSILSKSKKDNHGKLEQQIRDAYALVNYNGMAFRNARITEEYLDARLQELHWAIIVQELRAKEIEEQRAIRERMREEEKARREFERAQKAAAKEEAMLKKAMEKARAMLEKASEDQKAQYEAQLADLAEKLKEAEEKGQRALSMAQQTKRGTVYVISNIGSFGENVYKVGMTRRLEPMERVKELGDASVPFPFDVHAFIESDDAPALETELHHELSLVQMNKVNPRKEFFRIDISAIKAMVEKKGLTATWTMAAEAAEYRETLAIEEQMKDDPEMREKWLAYAKSVSDENEEEEEVA